MVVLRNVTKKAQLWFRPKMGKYVVLMVSITAFFQPRGGF